MVAGYVKWLEPRYSEATARSYQLYVWNFFKYLKYWHRKIKDVKEITPEIIAKYVSFIQARSAKNGEVAKRLRFFAVKNFLEWLGTNDFIDANPLEKVKAPKRDCGGYKGDILVEKEIWALLDAPAKKEKISARDKAILELLFWTAMTSRELVNLKDGHGEARQVGLALLDGVRWDAVAVNGHQREQPVVRVRRFHPD